MKRLIISLGLATYLVGCTTLYVKQHDQRYVDVSNGVTKDAVVLAVLHVIDSHYLNPDSASRLFVWEPKETDTQARVCFKVSAENTLGGQATRDGFNSAVIDKETGLVGLGFDWLAGDSGIQIDCRNHTHNKQPIYKKRNNLFDYPGFDGDW